MIKNAFTLIEILLVTSLFAIIIGVITTSFSGHIQENGNASLMLKPSHDLYRLN